MIYSKNIFAFLFWKNWFNKFVKRIYLKLFNQPKAKPCLPYLIAASNFYFNISYVGYLGNLIQLEHVDAVGKDYVLWLLWFIFILE